MSKADDIDPFASLSEWIAYEIRKRRRAAGWTQRELAELLSVVESQVGHLEAGRRELTLDQARRLDGIWSTDRLFETLWTHAKREHQRDWFRRFTGYEQRAEIIRLFQPLVIPGLFQTSEYARALFEAGRAPNIDEAIAARMRRQEILDRESSPLVWAVIGEATLREPIGGRTVLREQLSRLLEVTKLPHVTLQVIRAGAGAHIGLDGGFTLLDVGDEGVAFIEAQLTGRLVRDNGEIRILRVWFDLIRSKALSEDDSFSLVASIMESV